MLQIKCGSIRITSCKSIGSRLLMIWLLNTIVLTVARFILVRLNITGLARNCVLWVITFIPLICFFVNARNIPQKAYRFFLFIFIIVSLSFAFTAVINDDIKYFYTRETYGLERVFRPDSAIYALLFFGLVDDWNELSDTVRKYAYIDFAGLLVFDFLPACLHGGWEDITYSGATVLYRYSLSFGYAMAFPTVVFIYLYLKNRKAIDLLLSFAGVVLIFTNGSRGSLLIVAAFIALLIISNIIDSNKSQKIVKIGAVLTAIIALLLLWKPMFKGVAIVLQSAGIQSRTLDMILKGTVASDNGRNEIWSAVIQAIKTGGIFGHGAYGDRPFVFPLHFAAYSHNIFLEIICSFGIIGVMICLAIVVGSVWMIFCCKDTLTRELFIVFFSVSLQLCLSFSFWYVWEFWAMIAIAYSYFRDNMPVFLNAGNKRMKLKKNA